MEVLSGGYGVTPTPGGQTDIHLSKQYLPNPLDAGGKKLGLLAHNLVDHFIFQKLIVRLIGSDFRHLWQYSYGIVYERRYYLRKTRVVVICQIANISRYILILGSHNCPRRTVVSRLK